MNLLHCLAYHVLLLVVITGDPSVQVTTRKQGKSQKSLAFRLDLDTCSEA